jgi:D-alanyl-D-alanine carboxypeptidase (penicillin-binding protein 5/6)
MADGDLRVIVPAAGLLAVTVGVLVAVLAARRGRSRHVGRRRA